MDLYAFAIAFLSAGESGCLLLSLDYPTRPDLPLFFSHRPCRTLVLPESNPFPPIEACSAVARSHVLHRDDDVRSVFCVQMKRLQDAFGSTASSPPLISVECVPVQPVASFEQRMLQRAKV